MKHAPGDSRHWYGLACLGMTGTLCVWGMLANRLTPLQVAATVGFAGVVLLMAWMWQLSARRAAMAAPLTRGQVVWNAALFVAWLAMLLSLGFWYSVHRGE